MAPYELPSESEANASTAANNAVTIAAANAAFIASTNNLINSAAPLGLFEVEPILIANVDVPTVTAYFVGQGFDVSFPLVPPGPFSPPLFIPEVLPPGYTIPNQPFQTSPPRFNISWGILQSFYLLEDGNFLESEDGSGQLLVD